MRILVVGGGIGGLSAGVALGRLGHTVGIVEAARESSAAGVGIAQPANALRVMRELGLLEHCLDAGFQYDRSIFCDAAGRVLVEVQSYLRIDGLPPANALPRRTLHEILSAAVARSGASVHYDLSLTDLVSDDVEAEATFSDAARASYDLVVGFDGIYSTVRSRLFPQAAGPTFTGYSVWRLTVPRPAEVTCPLLFQGRRTKAGVIPIGDQSMYLLAVTSEHSSPVRLERSEFPELLRERLEEFAGLIGDIRDAPILAEDVVYSPIEETLLSEPWYRGVAAVAGDAAHASAPHLTQGAAMAMEDAFVLAELLEEKSAVGLALAAWCARRYPRCQGVQAASHAVLVAETVHDEQSLVSRLGELSEDMPARLHAIQMMLKEPA